MEIIITENQHSSLKNNLIDVINRFGIGGGIKTVGSFKVLLKIIGKETLMIFFYNKDLILYLKL